MYKFVLIFLTSIFGFSSAFGQCDCMSSSQATGIQQFQMPEEFKDKETIGKFKLSALYKSIYGDKYFSGNSEAPADLIKYFKVDYTNLMLTYYLNDRFILFSDLGFFIRKAQAYRLPPTEVVGSGFSHINLGAKYSIFENTITGNELLLSTASRLPLAKYDSTLPYHIQASSGAIGLNGMLTYYHSFFNRKLNLISSIGYDYSFENDRKYQYGANINFDVTGIYKINSELSFSIGNRIEYRNKDKYFDTTITKSGGIFVSISPGLHYRISDILLSGLFEIPYFRNVNGTQLVTNYSFLLNISWYFKI